MIAALIGDIYYLLGHPGVWINRLEADSPKKKKLKKVVKFAENLMEVIRTKAG